MSALLVPVNGAVDAIPSISYAESDWACKQCKSNNFYNARYLIKPCTVLANCERCGMVNKIDFRLKRSAV